MSNETMALREVVLSAIRDAGYDVDRERSEEALDDICDALEDTGSPAHMRVAAELRGE